MEEKKKIYLTASLAEQMWRDTIIKEKGSSINAEPCTFEDIKKVAENTEEYSIISVINNKALRNEVSKIIDIPSSEGFKVELKKGDLLFVISTTNLSSLLKYKDEEELPEGVNYQIIRYEI